MYSHQVIFIVWYFSQPHKSILPRTHNLVSTSDKTEFHRTSEIFTVHVIDAQGFTSSLSKPTSKTLALAELKIIGNEKVLSQGNVIVK